MARGRLSRTSALTVAGAAVTLTATATAAAAVAIVTGSRHWALSWSTAAAVGWLTVRAAAADARHARLSDVTGAHRTAPPVRLVTQHDGPPPADEGPPLSWLGQR